MQKLRLPDRRTLVIIVVAAVAALALTAYLLRGGSKPAGFKTVQVKRGDLQSTISATGTVEPEEVVDIGAQVAGKIVSFGKDIHGGEVDYGSFVEAGTVLAKIDDVLYASDAAAAKAQLAQAKAAVQKAEADLGQMKAKLLQTENDWKRAQKLGPSDALSKTDFDAARSNYEVAKAILGVGKAAIEQAKGTVAQAEATLKRALQNLSYCTIKSPVKGVIIDRRVNIGQTVVASLNAPSLCLLAKDLTRMQVWVSVNEADIGRIKPGQQVTFTADAYPGEVFVGEVGKVRLNATMTQNVVTYTVEIITDNSNGKLLPYLTANVTFIVGERKDVLLVPNAALRWTPQVSQVAPEFRGNPEKAPGAEAPAQAKVPAKAGKEEQARGAVYVPQGTLVRPVYVNLGLSDGSQMEVESRELKEGTPLVVGEMESQSAGKPGAGGSPFTPQLRRRSANPPSK
ncbi:MAG: efflux RND transporter periplasmic adaptor subunit [Deltaproteobacteria bacterium]|nr:efflux RND transporter periplasmic adaptor subunit [Deltaproteobacteria bacterium]